MDSFSIDTDGRWSDWPECRRCGRYRQTVCPTCGQGGNQFPLAEYQALAEPQRGTRPEEDGAFQPRVDPSHVLLICPQCDEAFAPRFYRLCPACGDDAGDGLETAVRTRAEISSRVLLAVYTLAAVCVTLLLYFWFLFRNQ